MPPSNYFETLMEERDTLSAAIEQTVTSAQDNGGLGDDDKTKIKGMQTRVADIDSELTILATEQDSLRKANEFAAKFLRAPKPPANEYRAPESTSLGTAFTGSAEFRDYGTNPRGKSNYFEFTDPGTPGGDGNSETRAPAMTGGFPGSIKPSSISVPEPTEQFPLFGLVGMEQVSTGSFEYVRTVFDDNAAVVPEGGVKPESTITEQVTPGALDTIAHWTQVTRQALEDSARIRSVIDGKLTEGVQRKIHNLIADDLNATALPGVTAADLLSAIRVGIATVQEAGWTPNALLLNPQDWAALDISVMSGTLNGPSRNQSFWGLTPVAYSGQTAGTAIVGDFKTGETLFYRAGVGVYATDSHADTFTSNVFTILAERRAKAACLNPTCFAECSAGA
jgi:HK97 family phage major capsid protein